jgi:hypothetical protein
MFLREDAERGKYSLRNEGEKEMHTKSKCQKTQMGLWKTLDNNALIINEEIPHQKITGCTNIIWGLG